MMNQVTKLQPVTTPAALLSSLRGIPRMALSYLFDDSENFKMPKDENQRIEFLKNVEFYAVLEAGSLGLLSGLMIVLATAMIEPFEGLLLEDLWWDSILILGLVIFAGTLITMLELVIMYYLSLRAARLIARINQHSTNHDDTDAQVMYALVNAGLQTPNNRGIFFGIDPRNDIPRWKVLLVAIFFKTKVSVSRTLIKMLWRRFALRVFGRTVSRGALELASLPVFAFWNMWVIRRTISELRFRSEIPLRENDIVEFILGELSHDFEARHLALEMMAEHIYGAGDVHPNIERLFRKIHQMLPQDGWEVETVTRLRGRNLDVLSDEYVEVCQRSLAISMAMDPRSKRNHRRLFDKLEKRLKTPKEWKISALKKCIISGKSLP